jgi:hypothetical protein
MCGEMYLYFEPIGTFLIVGDGSFDGDEGRLEDEQVVADV